jgi:hypothetical protein
MARIKWEERKFNFDFPAGIYPEMIERFRGTPPRIEDRVKGLPVAAMTRRDGDKWSIQENIGHLLDLEALVAGRLDDYDAGHAALRAADMSNRRTHDARHNERPIEDLLRAFRQARLALVERLEMQPPEYFARTALHPRLKKDMRVTDMLFFQSEHDDYHVARISELIRLFHQA